MPKIHKHKNSVTDVTKFRGIFYRNFTIILENEILFCKDNE